MRQKTGEGDAGEYFAQDALGKHLCRHTTHASVEVDIYGHGTYDV